MIFAKSPSIKKDIKRIRKRIRINKNLTEDEKVRRLLFEMRHYYLISKFELKVYFKRLEYLEYERNMRIGITSGFVASIIVILLSWGIKEFGPNFNQFLITIAGMLSKVITYILMIFSLFVLVVIPCYLLIKALLLYCFNVFFDGKQSYINNYEIEVIREVLSKKIQITSREHRRLITYYGHSTRGVRENLRY